MHSEYNMSSLGTWSKSVNKSSKIRALFFPAFATRKECLNWLSISALLNFKRRHPFLNFRAKNTLLTFQIIEEVAFQNNFSNVSFGKPKVLKNVLFYYSFLTFPTLIKEQKWQKLLSSSSSWKRRRGEENEEEIGDL